VPAPNQVAVDPRVLIITALITGFLILLVPFPSDLFNRTYSRNHDEIMGWFGRLGRSDALTRIEGRGVQHTTAFVVFAFMCAALNSVLSPAARVDLVTMAAIVGIAGAMIVLSIISSLTSSLYLHRRVKGIHLRILLSALPIAAVCVLISRAADFQPGYLYGLIGAFTVAATPTPVQAGRAVALSTVVSLALAVAAWLIRIPVAPLASGADPAFMAIVANTFLTSVFVSGLEHLVFRLVPLRFLDGAALRGWSTPVWAVLFGVGLFGFLQILINPAGGYTHLADMKRTGLITALVLFAAFGLFSFAFWGYFRFRPEREKRNKVA